MTEAELVAACRKWQVRLRLQDWTVVVRLARMHEMRDEDGADRGGTIMRYSRDRLATIKILDSVDYPPECALPEDQEATLVHELLHIYTDALQLPAEGSKHIAEEQMVNALAEALVALERAGIAAAGESEDVDAA